MLVALLSLTFGACDVLLGIRDPRAIPDGGAGGTSGKAGIGGAGVGGASGSGGGTTGKGGTSGAAGTAGATGATGAAGTAGAAGAAGSGHAGTGASGASGGAGSAQAGTGGAAAGTGGTNPAPTPFLLDDFEDGNALPFDPRFADWQFYKYNTTVGFVSSTPFGPGFLSNGAIDLEWEIYDPVDQIPNYPGAGLRTLVSQQQVAVDLSRYTRIVFSHRYTHSGTCRALTQLHLAIWCGERATSFVRTIPVSTAWQTTTLELSSFQEGAYPPPNGTPLSACLAAADDFLFQAQVDLKDGECASGRLEFDTISFR